jgi:hypothetical protein
MAPLVNCDVKPPWLIKLGALTAISGMTASGVVVCTPAESLGTNIVLSHVVAGSGIITVFAQDTNASGAAAGIASKAINYIVISK